MIKALRHVGIVVRDLERSLWFYRDLLGLKIITMADESGDYLDNMLALKKARVITVKLAIEGDLPVVELLDFQTPKGDLIFKRELYDVGLTHMAFTVDNLDELYQKLIAAGVYCTAMPQIPPSRSVKVTFCRDPDGTPIELVQVL